MNFQDRGPQSLVQDLPGIINALSCRYPHHLLPPHFFTAVSVLWGSLTPKENSSDTYLGTSLLAPSSERILNLLSPSTGIVLSLL